MQKKYYVLCLVFSLWTVIQTGFHLVFVMYAYYLSICVQTPHDENSILFYLTYFYDSSCLTPSLRSLAPGESKSLETLFFGFASSMYPTDNITLVEFVQTLLENIENFPSTVVASSRTSVFLLCFIILDAMWIVAAVALFMGTVCGIKQSLALAFYGPWLIMTICVAIFDATSSVFFGFDIAQTATFSGWLNFVGITETSRFPDFDSMESMLYVTSGPSIALCALSSRFAIVWLINWAGFVVVMKTTVSVYRESYAGSKVESSDRSRIDQTTSAARIRNWQMFYGAVNANSTMDGSNASTVSKPERDLNSNSHEDMTNMEEQSGSELCDGGTAAGNFYRSYGDVAENVDFRTEDLRGQRPWTYIYSQKSGLGETVEMESMGRRHHERLKSDSSHGSGTEL